jgi:NADH-quinone oxidoreductase subunit J
MTANLLYIASVFGALAVYFVLPHRRRAGKLGGLLGVATLGALFVSLAKHYQVENIPGLYYYAFTLISLVAAVRVITHPRPVYSALYFVLVVLSSAGMLVLLAAEFMAFAMVIIYGGAILVTYMFVIMLATMPQSDDRPETAAPYDRIAREPLVACVLGFLLIAGLSSVIFDAQQIPRNFPTNTGDAAAQMRTRIDASQLETLLRQRGLITEDETIASQDVNAGESYVLVRSTPGVRPKRIAITDELRSATLSNIDYVGLTLFEGHTLGIELAGVVLLLAMVGAIVIARQKVEDEPEGAGHA